MLGVLRFYKSWSLKPFIYAGVLTLSAITLYFQFEPSGTLSPVLGLAWDCGAVTTGPVTVPLVWLWESAFAESCLPAARVTPDSVS